MQPGYPQQQVIKIVDSIIIIIFKKIILCLVGSTLRRAATKIDH